MIKSNDPWALYSYETGFKLGLEHKNLDMSCADYWCKLGYKIANKES